MTATQRVGKVLSAFFSVLCAWILLDLGEDGPLLVGFLLCISLIVFALRNIFFYFTMARHMVDGRSILYIGVIVLDLGIFTMSVLRYSHVFIAVYLLATYAFTGAVHILHALEARRFRAPSWRLNLAEGIAKILFALAAVIFGFICGNMQVLTAIYAAGMLYSALLKLISAFRKTAIPYIP
jgi:uncharacterized membrane protein HdeD (DUF308 family)